MRALLTLYLLAFATSAHAECAWVLWSAEVERRDGKTLRRQWVPHSGAESVGECRKAMLDSDLKKKYVVINRATARTKDNRLYAHLSCVVGSKKSIHDMSDMELEADVGELEEKLARLPRPGVPRPVDERPQP